MKEQIRTTGRVSRLNLRQGQAVVKVFLDPEQLKGLQKIMGEEVNITIERAQLELFEEECQRGE